MALSDDVKWLTEWLEDAQHCAGWDVADAVENVLAELERLQRAEKVLRDALGQETRKMISADYLRGLMGG